MSLYSSTLKGNSIPLGVFGCSQRTDQQEQTNCNQIQQRHC